MKLHLLYGSTILTLLYFMASQQTKLDGLDFQLVDLSYHTANAGCVLTYSLEGMKPDFELCKAVGGKIKDVIVDNYKRTHKILEN